MALARPPLITQPFSCPVPGLGAAGALQVFRRVAGGFEGTSCTFLIEQRILQFSLELGDLLKRRKTERKQNLYEKLVKEYDLDPGHIVEPLLHQDDNAAVILFSFPVAIGWLTEKVFLYEKAHGSHGSEGKLRRIRILMGEWFHAAASVCRRMGPEAAPTMAIDGVDIAILADSFSLDLQPVIDAFPPLENEWKWMHETGRHDAPYPGTVASVIVVYFWLCRRILLIAEPQRAASPLTSFRNAIVGVVGALIERQVAWNKAQMPERPAHQEIGGPEMHGKKGIRRVRRSTGAILQNLRIAERAGHAAAVLRATTGSNWMAAATTRARCTLYRRKVETTLCKPDGLAMSWDGTSASGLNVHVAVAYDFGQHQGGYLTPKDPWLFVYKWIRRDFRSTRRHLVFRSDQRHVSERAKGLFVTASVTSLIQHGFLGWCNK